MFSYDRKAHKASRQFDPLVSLLNGYSDSVQRAEARSQAAKYLLDPRLLAIFQHKHLFDLLKEGPIFMRIQRLAL